MNNKRRLLIIGAGVIVLLCLCLAVTSVLLPDNDQTELESETIDEVAIVAEDESPEATETVSAEETPEATDTSVPTDTPAPTDTPTPTNTPRPTSTPTITPSPTVTPTPIVITGNGDSLVDIEKGDEPAVVHIIGNSSSRHFSVVNYDAGGDQIDLLVNTTDPYEGIRPLDFRTDEHTAGFEVTAVGEWTIEVLTLSSIKRLSVPGTIEGIGDDVVALIGGTPDRATISGNTASRHFGVFGYGSGIDLLVNTTDPYEGTVRLDSDTLIIEVQAVGEWSVTTE